MQDAGSVVAATSTTGWVCAQNVIGQSCVQNGGSEISRTDGQWGATLQPSAAPSQTVGDCWRSESLLDGTFANTNWSLKAGFRSVTAAYTGRLKLAFRLWKGSNANAVGAVELTTGRVASAATSANLATASDSSLTWTWTPGKLVTLANEYLWLQLGFEVTAAGSGNTQDFDFRVSSADGYALTTPDFADTLWAQSWTG